MSPQRSDEENILPLARDLNERLAKAAPEVFEMLSALGRRLYFPKGILSQGAEAKQKAKRVNATIGIATENGKPMHLPSIASHLVGIASDEAFDYAPPAGQQKLRERWRDKIVAENPGLAGRAFGLPIVTSAITHGLMLAGDLFVDPGDVIVLPDKVWDNYKLTFEVRLGARVVGYPFYAGEGFDCAGFAAAMEEAAGERDKVIALLNFPNNPTGYMPTQAESRSIAETLLRQAERGTRVIALLDDAYFGLFYHLGRESSTTSLFADLVNRHPNLLAIRLDGATKELFVWGLRCGFITFGPGRAASAPEVCDVLEAKVKGAVRSAISNVPQLSQTLVLKALASPTIDAERAVKNETLRRRAERVYEVARAPRFRESWTVYPFNSGYFMCVQLTGVEAERVRLHLLDQYGIGTIATGGHDLRIAFSCMEVDQVEELFETLHRAVQELRST
jgi:aspartate/methionine/tyrosine aminotransferase